MALRRKRTINPKYLSEDFESVFTEKKDLMSDSYVVMDDANVVVDDSGVVSNSGEFVTQVSVVITFVFQVNSHTCHIRKSFSSFFQFRP